MIEVDAFITTCYRCPVPLGISTLKDFCEWKEKNGYEEWDYPLDEFEHTKENGINCVPVRFKDDCRLCEIPESFDNESTEMPYPDYILRDVRQNMGVEPDDESRDDEIRTMSPTEIFDKWLEWQGIIGYSHRILNAIEEIFDIDLGE